jgi:hypothetical protein
MEWMEMFYECFMKLHKKESWVLQLPKSLGF